jgi:hypothetical protein
VACEKDKAYLESRSQLTGTKAGVQQTNKVPTDINTKAQQTFDKSK